MQHLQAGVVGHQRLQQAHQGVQPQPDEQSALAAPPSLEWQRTWHAQRQRHVDHHRAEEGVN